MDPLRVAETCRNVMLVVDDDSAVGNSLKFVLEVEGFQVRVFSSAEELLNEDSLPDASCLVVDYYMPGMNGLKLVAHLRDRNVLIPPFSLLPHPAKTCAIAPLRWSSDCRETAAGQSFVGLSFGRLLTEIEVSVISVRVGRRETQR